MYNVGDCIFDKTHHDYAIIISILKCAGSQFEWLENRELGHVFYVMSNNCQFRYVLESRVYKV